MKLRDNLSIGKVDLDPEEEQRREELSR